MLEKKQINDARKILTDAGMNREIMESNLYCEEFVEEVLYQPNAAKEWDEHCKKNGYKGIDDKFIAQDFVCFLTTD